jgi:hypothetical protein
MALGGRRNRKVQAPQKREDDAPVEPEIKDTGLGEAIAEHFGINLDEISGFVVSCEYTHEVEETSMTSLSSAWSVGVPAWRLRGIVAELAKHLEKVG